MKVNGIARIIGVFSFVFLLLTSATSCMNAEVSEDSSPGSSEIVSQETRSTDSEAIDTSSYFSNELPPLTAEEESKINDFVPVEMWATYYSSDIELEKPIYRFANISELFEKPLEEITYGEVWRFNNQNKTLKLIYSPPPIVAEMKSVKSITVGEEANFTLLEYLSKMDWIEEFYVSGGGSVPPPFEGKAEPVYELLEKMDNLRVLGLDCLFDYTYFDVKLPHPEKLESLQIELCGIREFPMCILEYSNLKELTLDCWITSFPNDLSGLSQVKKAKFNLPLYEIPVGIGDLTSVEELAIGFGYSYDSNKAPTPEPFPQWFEEYKSNKPTTLPVSIAKLNNLKSFSIRALCIESVEPEVKEYFENRKDSLTVIYLGSPEDELVTLKTLGLKS